MVRQGAGSAGFAAASGVTGTTGTKVSSQSRTFARAAVPLSW